MTNQEFIESIRIDGEHWRAIPNLDNAYYVSTFGRVASMPRITFRNGKSMKVQGRVMRQLTDNLGYKYLFLRKENGYFRKFVHWLVAFTFIPNPEGKPEIDHLDTNPANNRVSNLRWCTASENRRNPITLKRLIENTPIHKQVPIIRISATGKKVYDSYSEAARDGFDINGIRRCIHRGQLNYKGFEWKLLSDHENLVSMSKNSSTPGND